MKVPAALAVGCVVVLTSCSAHAIGGLQSSGTAVGAPVSRHIVLAVGQPVSVQPQTGLVFTPADAPRSGSGYLSAASAWADWEDGGNFDSSFAAPQFGKLVQLAAPAGTPGNKVSYEDHAVWAFRQVGCLVANGGIQKARSRSPSAASPSTDSPSPTPIPTNSFGPCIEWTFLDARTGQGVLVTQQSAP